MKNRLIANGFNDYLNKPFRPEELHAKIAQYSARQEIR
jgi:DNA-binding response OmpR family regulator